MTKAGKPRYWFSTKAEGDLADALPEGYEVYENPGAQVFARKSKPRFITPEEVAVVEEGLRRFAPGQSCLVDVRDKHIEVHHANRVNLDDFGLLLRERVLLSPYMKVMRFTLVDPRTREFQAGRWCFRGSVDRWIDLFSSGSTGPLPTLVERYCGHIGRDSFFELM